MPGVIYLADSGLVCSATAGDLPEAIEPEYGALECDASGVRCGFSVVENGKIRDATEKEAAGYFEAAEAASLAVMLRATPVEVDEVATPEAKLAEAEAIIADLIQQAAAKGTVISDPRAK